MFGYKFRRQHIIKGFILDFYCPELHLGIEVDGSIHNDPLIKIQDKQRSHILNECNITMLRFCNEDIVNNILHVRTILENHIKEISTHFFI